MKKTNIKLRFIGSIDEGNVRKFVNEIKEEIERNPESTSITIYLSSSGGSVDIAVELFHFLKLLDCKITMVNMSCVNSAAVIVFAAGEERLSLPCSSFYVHSVTKKLDGSFTIDDLKRELQEMTANTNKIAEILSSASNKSRSYWKRLMRKGSLLTSQKAKELGLINGVSDYE